MIESVLGAALVGAARRVSRVSNAACHAQTPPSFQTAERECVDEPADLGEPCERMRSKQPWSTSPRALGLDSDLRTDVVRRGKKIGHLVATRAAFIATL